jgi:molybdopterin molybdotransferase
MLTYERALARILARTPRGRTATVALSRALGLTLARPVRARCDLPGFDNTAVDGYAVRLPGAAAPPEGAPAWRLVGASAAGRPFRGVVGPGQAVRVLTGARLPRGANTVLMQERVRRRRDHIVADRWPTLGQHIRRRGEDVRAGAPVLAAGTTLRPQEIAILAALGVARVVVFRRPVVAMLVTGDELRRPGARLADGQIYDSNGPLLEALAQSAGASPRRLGRVADRLAPLAARIRRGLAAADVLVISGGVSVGDRDYVRAAARRCGVRPVFWGVNIKPGKPLFFGRRGRTLVFGLPGNPVSVFVTFQEFVRPALCRLMGRPWEPGYRTPATLARDVAVSPSRRTHFLRVTEVSRNGHLTVAPVQGQGSHQLLSLVRADGWVRLSSGDGPWPAGTPVLVKSEERAPW